MRSLKTVINILSKSESNTITTNEIKERCHKFLESNPDPMSVYKFAEDLSKNKNIHKTFRSFLNPKHYTLAYNYEFDAYTLHDNQEVMPGIIYTKAIGKCKCGEDTNFYNTKSKRYVCSTLCDRKGGV